MSTFCGIARGAVEERNLVLMLVGRLYDGSAPCHLDHKNFLCVKNEAAVLSLSRHRDGDLQAFRISIHEPRSTHWQDESDYERCPLFRYCPRYETTLSPGDVLWNPYYWFHSVKNLTRSSVAVADRWFGTPGRDFQSPLPLYDLATSLCPQSVDVDVFIQWMLIQQNITNGSCSSGVAIATRTS